MRATTSASLTMMALIMMSVAATAQEEVTVVPDALFCGGITASDADVCETGLRSLAEAGLVPESYAELLAAPTGVGGPNATESGVVVDGYVVRESGGYPNTVPFVLSGGDYIARIYTGECTGFSFAALMPTNGFPQGFVDTERGDSYSYGVKPGRYYWDVNGNCDEWTVTLAPSTG